MAHLRVLPLLRTCAAPLSPILRIHLHTPYVHTCIFNRRAASSSSSAASRTCTGASARSSSAAPGSASSPSRAASRARSSSWTSCARSRASGPLRPFPRPYVVPFVSQFFSCVERSLQLGILAHAFPPSRARSIAFATFSAGAPVGGAVGMQIGGILTEWAPYVLFITFSFLSC